MRAFVSIRQVIADSLPLKRLSTLEKNFNELKQDLEEIFADYNDINEDTRAQIEAINTTLAELQAFVSETLLGIRFYKGEELLALVVVLGLSPAFGFLLTFSHVL